MSTVPEGHSICRYCRMAHPMSSPTCPSCGAPLDVRQAVTRSGWLEQPPIRDMARIQFGQSRVQIEGAYVPVADFALSGQEWIYFSHHALLWTDPAVQLTGSSLAGGLRRMLAGGTPALVLVVQPPAKLDPSGRTAALLRREYRRVARAGGASIYRSKSHRKASATNSPSTAT